MGSRSQSRNLETVEEERTMELETRVDRFETTLEGIISKVVREA